MQKGLIQENINNALNSLIGDMFSFNRLLDRMMSVLSVKMVMPKTANSLHTKLAHRFPTIADFLSDYQNDRNNLTIYPETPIGNEDYNTPLELFQAMLVRQLLVEENFVETKILAKNSGDYMTAKILDDLLPELKKVTAQILVLCDKAEIYGDMPKHWMDFDFASEDFITLEVLQNVH